MQPRPDATRLDAAGIGMDVDLRFRLVVVDHLLLRLGGGGADTALELQQLLLRDIRDEYNHNLSQQVYMSQNAWDQVQTSLNDVTTLINQAAGDIRADVPAIELSRRIFERIIQRDRQPTAEALRVVKEEIQTMFM